MFLLDGQNAIIDAECSLAFLDGSPCIIVESSGGANAARGVKRRNPDYNNLLNAVFARLAHKGIQITRVILDSSTVSNLAIEERTANLGRPYPIDLASTDIDEFRKILQREIASMHQEPSAKSGGNAQKRVRFCLSRAIAPDLLLTEEGNSKSTVQMPDYTPGLTETERNYLRAARIGQGQFRQDLMKAYMGACPVTGITTPDLLIASHIKPWKACANTERLDPKNGILLSALVDRLFDRGLITFDEAGRIVVSPSLSIEEKTRCGLGHSSMIELSERSQLYMQYHRAIEFKSS